MTVAALIVAVTALALVFAERRQRRRRDLWEAERAAYHERIAARNGRPHGNVVVLHNGYDHPEPDELTP